jgi:Glycosyltransferase family 17
VDGIVAGSAQLAAARPRARRIFDTFPFDGELMMLVHRLDEVYEHVDGIILVEAGMTYRGRPKELTFAKHRARLAWANAKLRYVQLASLGPERSQPRERAAIQQNAITRSCGVSRLVSHSITIDADGNKFLTSIEVTSVPLFHGRIQITCERSFRENHAVTWASRARASFVSGWSGAKPFVRH